MNEFVNGIVDIINKVGFPIAAFLLMWYQNMQITKSINANTEVINKMIVKLDDIEKKVA